MEFVEKPKYEHILLAIDDQIKIIDKVNEAINRHQGDKLQELQYKELKEKYTNQLKDLLVLIFQEHNIPLKLSA